MPEIGGRVENLIPCKPGETANPNGRPKGRKSISTYLKMFVEGGLDKLPNEELRKKLEEQGFDCVAAALAFKKLSMALSNKAKPDTQLRAMDSIEDRLEGKATQKNESKLEVDLNGAKLKQCTDEQLESIIAGKSDGGNGAEEEEEREMESSKSDL